MIMLGDAACHTTRVLTPLFELLVQRVEALLKSETTGLAQAMRATGAADKAAREHTTDPTR